MSNHRRRVLIVGLGLMATILAASGAFVGIRSISVHAAGGSGTTLQQLQVLTRSATITSSSPGTNASSQLSGDDEDTPKVANSGATNNQDTATNAPNPKGQSVTSQNFGVLGFQGLNMADQANANHGNQFAGLEPPDQGLCEANGYVVEPVNDVIAVYSAKTGALISGPEDLNSFFGLADQFNNATGVQGPFLSDPKCFYDGQSGRWFVTELELDNQSAVTATERNHTIFAVSQTSNPLGTYTVFQIDSTDDGLNGTPSNPNCPCLGDQPLVGFDSNGFYLSTNEFPEFANGFNGSQIYAMSKSEIVAAANGGPMPTVVHINAGPDLLPYGGTTYSVQPDVRTPGDFDPIDAINQHQEHGIEYFLSALQFGPNPVDNRIAAWAMTNTQSLNDASPNVTLDFQVISSETYGQPNPAPQKAGPTPFLDFLTSLGFSNVENQLNTNDDRMNQVDFAQNTLYSGVNTLLANNLTGLAWFAVTPEWHHGNFSAHTIQQGYISVDGQSLLFPSIAVNAFGVGAVSFTLDGANYYPTAAYIGFNRFLGGTVGPIHIVGAGVGPADGFVGYNPFAPDPTVERWGDYSAAVVDPNNQSIWIATEYIAQTCSDTVFDNDMTCGGTRTEFANWSTFVSNLGHI